MSHVCIAGIWVFRVGGGRFYLWLEAVEKISIVSHPSVWSIDAFGRLFTTRPKGAPPSESDAYPGGLQIVWEAFKQRGLPESVISVMSNSLAPTTWKQYDSTWEKMVGLFPKVRHFYCRTVIQKSNVWIFWLVYMRQVRFSALWTHIAPFLDIPWVQTRMLRDI